MIASLTISAPKISSSLTVSIIFRSGVKVSAVTVTDFILARTNVLISSSGSPVANQQYFIKIFNVIVDNELCIEFYHQRGHVGESGGVSKEKARAQFIKANKVSPELMGIDINLLCQYNHIIDNLTRNAVRQYVDNNKIIENAYMEPIHPIEYSIHADMLPVYISCINKTSVPSRHDFKGGYSQ